MGDSGYQSRRGSGRNLVEDRKVPCERYPRFDEYCWLCYILARLWYTTLSGLASSCSDMKNAHYARIKPLPRFDIAMICANSPSQPFAPDGRMDQTTTFAPDSPLSIRSIALSLFSESANKALTSPTNSDVLKSTKAPVSNK